MERINFVSMRQSSPQFLSSLIIKYIAKGYGNKSFPKLIIKYLSDIDKLYKYDLFIRDVLFNTYKISLLRKRIIWEANKCGYIDNIDDLLNLLLNDLNNLENFTSYHKKEWLNILSSFYTIKNQELENLI